MKVTAIYVDSWMSGSRQVSLTRVRRLEVNENETINDALDREGIKEQTEYLFDGWPKQIGEKTDA